MRQLHWDIRTIWREALAPRLLGVPSLVLGLVMIAAQVWADEADESVSPEATRLGSFGPCEFALNGIDDYVAAFESLGWERSARGDDGYTRNAAAVGEIAWLFSTFPGPFENTYSANAWLATAQQYGDSISNDPMNALLTNGEYSLLVRTTGFGAERSVGCLIVSNTYSAIEEHFPAPRREGFAFDFVEEGDLPTPFGYFRVTLVRLFQASFTENVMGGSAVQTSLIFSSSDIESWDQ